MDPEARIVGVLLFEPLLLVDLPPEGPDHSDAGQILLDDGGKLSLFRIHLAESGPDPGMENHGIAHDDGYEGGGAQHDRYVDAGHEI